MTSTRRPEWVIGSSTRAGKEGTTLYALGSKRPSFNSERQMGVLLEKSERAKGGAQPGVGRRGKQCGNQGVPHCEQSTLEELGLKTKEAQQMGVLLEKSERAAGTKGQLRGRDVSGGTRKAPPENTPTLEELGLKKKGSPQSTGRRFTLGNPTPSNAAKAER